MLTKKTAVIADDDKETLRTLVSTLEDNGFEVALALDSEHALQLIKKVNPILVISEIGKNNYDGVGLFEAYKMDPKINDNLKMVILTSSIDENLEIKSFESGVDDFLIKPLRKNAFNKRILRYFIEQKKEVKSPKKQFQIRDLFFNLVAKTVYKTSENTPIQIQSKSFDILFFLAYNHDQVFSREVLIRAIWESNSKVTSRSIDVHILKIRQAIGEEYVKTIKGVGYIFSKHK
jgi:two-component system alkaline phosphatase synthesis response regulator PhoP